MNIIGYKISRYSSKAWQFTTVYESKQGNIYKKTKYPGNIREAAHSLIDAQLGGEFTTLEDLLNTLEKGIDRVVAQLEKGDVFSLEAND